MIERNRNPRLPARFGAPFVEAMTRSCSQVLPTLAAALLLANALPAFAAPEANPPAKPVVDTSPSADSKAGEEGTAPAEADSAEGTTAPAPAVRRRNLVDGIVASIDGDPITVAELRHYGVAGAPFLPAEVRGSYKALLDSMIENRLLQFEYEKNGIKASDEMVDRYISGVLADNQQNRKQLELDIAKAGLSWSDYYERMRQEVQRIQLVNLEIRSRVNIPEEEVRQAWEEDPQFLESEKLDVAVIYIPAPLSGDGADEAREKADEVRQQAKRNFSSAAKEHSQGPGASDGGELGAFERGTMAPHYEKALIGLDKGDVSVPIQGPGGYYIVKLLDVRSEGRKPFEDVKERLADSLYDKRLNERYMKWLDEDLRSQHRVEILVENMPEFDTELAPEPDTEQ